MRASEIIQEKNQKFLDDVMDKMGNDWKLNIDVSSNIYSSSSIQQQIKISTNDGKSLKTHVINYGSSIRLNDEVFDNLLSAMNKSGHLPDDVYKPIMNRNKIKTYNKIKSSLATKHDEVKVKPLKI